MNFFKKNDNSAFLPSIWLALLFVICFSHEGISSNSIYPQRDTILASKLNLQAIAQSQAKQYDSAIYYFGLAANQYKKANAWDRFFYAHYQAGYLFNVQYKYPETYQYLDSITVKYAAHLTPQLDSYQDYYGVLAWGQFRQLNYEKALYYFNFLDIGARQNAEVKPQQILFSKYHQGVIYQRLGQYDLALKYMLLTKDIGKKYNVNYYLGRTYNNLGIIYRNLGEYERALEFYKRALTIEKQYKKEVDLTPIYNNIGMLYYYLKEYAAALKELDYAFDVLTNYTPVYYPVESALINSTAIVLIDQGNYPQAKIILEKVLFREIDKYGQSWAGSSQTLQNLGITFAKMGDFVTSNQYYDQAIEITQKTLGLKTDKLSEVFNLKGRNYLDTKNYDDALQIIQQSLISLVADFNELDYTKNPDVTSIILDKVALIESQYLKSKALLAEFNNTHEVEYLNAAADANRTATQLVNIVRKNMLYESSKLNFSKKVKTIYEQAIIIALLLEKETGKEPFSIVFEAMENSKAYLLSEAIHKAKMLGYTNLPEEILVKEDSFRTKIKLLNKKRTNILLHANDSIALAEIDKQLFSTKESFEKYQQSYATNNLVEKHNMLKISRFKANFAENELIIEYFAGEGQLYSIALSKNKVRIYEFGAYQEKVNAFIRAIKQVQQITADEYQLQANEVFNIILGPILADYKLAKQLVIIPDKQIGFIPFDALVTTQVDNPRYNELAYLLNSYTLMQHQTVALYVNQQPYRHEQATEKFIGFAPDFNDNELMVAANKQLRSNLQPLPYAKKEVKGIANLLGGEEEIGVNASEANLKTKAAAFNILHLATHAIIDEENPIYSKLIFNTSDSTAEEDGELHSFEIYSMQLNCALVTLSACNTGTGKYLDGEGIFSLGRSFLMAGAESVLTSLWEVSDQSTSQIMEAFYTNIKTGKTSPEALRKAKLEYLKTSDPLTANPHYWAAFVYIGRPQAIYSSYSIYYWLGAIGLLLIGGFITAKKRPAKPLRR